MDHHEIPTPFELMVSTFYHRVPCQTISLLGFGFEAKNWAEEASVRRDVF